MIIGEVIMLIIVAEIAPSRLLGIIGLFEVVGSASLAVLHFAFVELVHWQPCALFVIVAATPLFLTTIMCYSCFHERSTFLSSGLGCYSTVRPNQYLDELIILHDVSISKFWGNFKYFQLQFGGDFNPLYNPTT